MESAMTGNDLQNENVQHDEDLDLQSDSADLHRTPEERDSHSDNLRQFSYFILFIAAVFAISAMETGSYRTPWPVAIITGIIGLGVFGYSCILQYRPPK